MVGCRYSSYLDYNNHVWYGGCDNALGRYDGTQWYMEGEDPELNNKSFSAIFLDIEDNMWLGTSTGLFVQNQDIWSEYTSENELDTDYIRDIRDDDNNIWIASADIDENKGCITKYDQTEFTHYYPNTFEGIPQKIIFRNDEIWVTDNNTVSYYKDEVWHVNELGDDISNEEILDITSDSENNIWLISDSVVFIIDVNNNVQNITNILGNELTNNRCLASFENNVWLNSFPYLFKYDGSAWSEIDLSDCISSIFRSVTPINENEIWVATWAGAMHYKEDTWQSYTEGDGLCFDAVNEISVSSNNIWFATHRGVSKFDGTEWTTYIQDSASIPNYNTNSSIHIDKKGYKWVGCPKGIYRYDDYNFFFKQPNDIDESINYITEDEAGNIWVAGQHGISKYTFAPDNIEDFAATSQSLELFPNPATGYFQIELNDMEQSDILKIYSISGKCVLSQQVFEGKNIIDVRNLSAGIYIVKLENSQKYGKFSVE